MGIENFTEYYEAQSKAGQGDMDYANAMDRTHTLDAILALGKRFTREYLVTLSTDDLHDLEDSLVNTQYET